MCIRDRHNSDRRTGVRLLLIFVVLAVGMMLAGYTVYRNYAHHYRLEVESELLSNAELKVAELTQWRKERIGDGCQFLDNLAFAGLVRHCQEKPEDAVTQRQLQDWLGKVQRYGPYDSVRLLDAQGHPVFSVPPQASPVAASVAQRIPEVLRSNQMTFVDFYRNEHDQRIYLALLVPVREEREGSQPLGVLLLRMDPGRYLYPVIQRWPTPSASAETLLVRRQAHDVLYLNELRHQTNAALALRLSQEHTETPVVKAALGQSGILDGTDYRGVPVIVAAQAVPDSPWSLVAKIDLAEVNASMRERLGQMLALLGALLLGAGAWLVWSGGSCRSGSIGNRRNWKPTPDAW